MLESLTRWHSRLDTPALIIDTQRMARNLTAMQNLAVSHNLRLRPHCKTHKSPQLARRQLELGAQGITVAKLSEAEIMAANGLSDIFIANQITHPVKIKRLYKLHRQTRLSIGIDHPRQLQLLKDIFTDSHRPLSLRLEIDCGFGRCGLPPADSQITDLARQIKTMPGLVLDGVFTHAGQAYAAQNVQQIKDIARQEAAAVVQAAHILRTFGIEVATVSVGSTPTAQFVAGESGINEIRPGNYIFYDAIQVGLGVATYDQCALFVLATVISRPSADRIVCDAGSKALNLDRGAHSAETVKGYGYLINMRGIIERVSEEHGIIRLDHGENINIGDPVLIIPNHACAVVNLYDHYTMINGTVQTLPILGRGKSQ